MPTIPPILLTKDLLLWDAFFKKLKVHFEVLRDKKAVVSLFQVINRLFQNTVDYQVRITTGVLLYVTKNRTSYLVNTMQLNSFSLPTLTLSYLPS